MTKAKGMTPKSVALDDESLKVLEQIKERGGNMSSIMRSLLKEYGEKIEYNLDNENFKNFNESTTAVKIIINNETKKIISDARKYHAININVVFQLMLNKFKENGYCFDNKLTPKMVHISIDDETYCTLDSIETCGLEMNATIRQLLREFKNNGFRFRSDEG